MYLGLYILPSSLIVLDEARSRPSILLHSQPSSQWGVTYHAVLNSEGCIGCNAYFNGSEVCDALSMAIR
jgi:hypothetical protein